MEASDLFIVFYHILEGSSKEKVQSALYSFGLVSRGAEAGPVVGSVASLVRAGLLGVEQYMPVFSHKETSHLHQESTGVVSLSKEVIFLGQMARKFLKVSEMDVLSLFLAKKD